jgi:hypothetical protein
MHQKEAYLTWHDSRYNKQQPTPHQDNKQELEKYTMRTAWWCQKKSPWDYTSNVPVLLIQDSGGTNTTGNMYSGVLLK